MSGSTRSGRLELVLRRPRLSLNPGVRPTVVVDGLGQPAQWGTGTWQRPIGDSPLGVYLYNRMWRYGVADAILPEYTTRVVYLAPRLPFGRGRLLVEHAAPTERNPSA